jgi:hypothetical protein
MTIVLFILVSLLTMFVGIRSSKMLLWFILSLLALSGPALFLYSNWLAPELGWDVSSTFGIGYVTLPFTIAASCGLGAFFTFLFKLLRQNYVH